MPLPMTELSTKMHGEPEVMKTTLKVQHYQPMQLMVILTHCVLRQQKTNLYLELPEN
jgi:hypothetical protein